MDFELVLRSIFCFCYGSSAIRLYLVISRLKVNFLGLYDYLLCLCKTLYFFLQEETSEKMDSDLEKKFVALKSDISDGAAQVGNTIVIHSSEETPEETFKRLAIGLESDKLMYKDVLDSIFNAVKIIFKPILFYSMKQGQETVYYSS